MLRFAIYFLLFIVLYNLLRSLLKKSVTSYRPEDSAERQTAELVMDPQCGTYVLPDQGVSAQVDGTTYYFCSEECRDKYLREHS